LLLSPLFYMYLYTWELHMYPCSNKELYVHGALLTGKCSGLVGLEVGVHYVCTPQGGSHQGGGLGGGGNKGRGGLVVVAV
jgi:hypothetical protein